MPVLPASVRLALWVTHAWSGGAALSLEAAIARALPDVDHTTGLHEELGLRRDLGEAALLTALPSPGDTTSLPRCGPVALQEAADAGEALVVPGLGGLLIPHQSIYGSAGAQARRIDWTAHEADPVPVHRVEALEPSQLERRLREVVRDATTSAEEVGGQPFAPALARELADTRLGGDWALPEGMPERARRVVLGAGTVAVVADLALHQPDGALDASTRQRREGVLRRLSRDADTLLTEATNAACAALAGWVPAR